VKVGTPFGEYPFEFRRLERRDGAVAVIGTVAGLESSVVFGREDLVRATKVLLPAAGAALVVHALRRRRAA
jgi:hypothetical protein